MGQRLIGLHPDDKIRVKSGAVVGLKKVPGSKSVRFGMDGPLGRSDDSDSSNFFCSSWFFC